MENYICQCITPKLSSDHIAKVIAPEGGLFAGELYVVDTLDNTIAGNIEVFTATEPATAYLGSKMFALVVNDGFETMDDGRRPDGQPNYYRYSFNEGDIAPVVFLDSHLVFNISEDAIGAEGVDVGKFLYPVDGSNLLDVGDSIPAGTACALKVVATYNTPIGGNFGGGFVKSFICIAQ